MWHDGDMADDDGIDLALYFADDGEPIASVPAPEPPGKVDITVRLRSGETWRVATVGETVRLTIAGADGMVTLKLDEDDADTLVETLSRGWRDVRATRRGY
jgi:hypothetical protein